MPEQELKTKTLAGIMQVLEAADDHLKLQIGNVKPTAWANSCTTPFDEIKALAGKNVVADYTEKENKKFPNSPYKNVIKVWLNVDVAPALNTPVSPNGESMTKEDWGLKDRRIMRVAIAKACIECTFDELALDKARTIADHWFNWVYELPQATKPFANPPLATADKPAVIPPAQGAKSKGALLNEVLDFVKEHKWGSAQIRQEAMRIAGEQGWENSEDISANSYKAMDLGQLAHFVAFLKTEIAKSATAK